MTEIDPKLGLPLHRQISALLMNQIANGEYRVGDRLPTEETLCRQFGVSRVTVRLALKELESADLLDRSPGRGTFLKTRPQRRRDDLLRDLVDLGVLARDWPQENGSVLRAGKARPPLRASRELGLDPETEAPYFIRMFETDGLRYAVKRFVRPELEPEIDVELRAAADFCAALARRIGRPVVDRSGWVEALLAEPHMIITLHLPVGSPLLSVWTIGEADGEPLTVAQMLIPGNSVGAAFTLESEPAAAP